VLSHVRSFTGGFLRPVNRPAVRAGGPGSGRECFVAAVLCQHGLGGYSTMYSMVLVASLATAGDAPAFGHKGGDGCYGGGAACYGGGAGCHGGGRAGFLGLRHKGGGCHGGMSYGGCYGSGGYYGGAGCYGSTPVYGGGYYGAPPGGVLMPGAPGGVPVPTTTPVPMPGVIPGK